MISTRVNRFVALCATVTTLFTALTFVSPVSSGAMTVAGPSQETVQAYEKASKYIMENHGDKYTNWWDVLATGEKVTEDQVTFPEIKDDSKIGDYINAVMMANVTGLRQQEGAAWAAKLAGMQDKDGKFSDLISQQLFAMIALNYNHTAYDFNKAADVAIDMMLKSEINRDTDYLGFAMVAFAAGKNTSLTAQGLINAFAYGSSGARVDGGYKSSWAEANANSTATILAGMAVAGVDFSAAAFFKNDKSIESDLIAFQMDNGAFKYLPSDTKENYMATQQAAIALRLAIASVEGKMGEIIPAANRVEDKTVTVNVYGIDGTLLQAKNFKAEVAKAANPAKGLTFEDALRQALDANNIKYTFEPSPYGGNYLSAVGDLAAAKFGGYDGWLCTLNRVSLSTGMSDYYINNNDVLDVYYGDFSATQSIDVSIKNVLLIKGMDAEITLTTKVDKYDDSWNLIGSDIVPVDGVTLKAFGKTYTSNKEGIITIPGADITQSGATEFEFSKWAADAVPGIVARTDDVYVVDMEELNADDKKGEEDKKDDNEKTSIKFAKKKVKIKKGRKVTLKVKATGVKKVKFSVNRKKVVRITKKKALRVTVKGLKKGAAVVTAKANGVKATCKVTVK